MSWRQYASHADAIDQAPCRFRKSSGAPQARAWVFADRRIVWEDTRTGTSVRAAYSLNRRLNQARNAFLELRASRKTGASGAGSFNARHSRSRRPSPPSRSFTALYPCFEGLGYVAFGVRLRSSMAHVASHTSSFREIVVHWNLAARDHRISSSASARARIFWSCSREIGARFSFDRFTFSIEWRSSFRPTFRTPNRSSSRRSIAWT